MQTTALTSIYCQQCNGYSSWCRKNKRFVLVRWTAIKTNVSRSDKTAWVVCTIFNVYYCVFDACATLTVTTNNSQQFFAMCSSSHDVCRRQSMLSAVDPHSVSFNAVTLLFAVSPADGTGTANNFVPVLRCMGCSTEYSILFWFWTNRSDSVTHQQPTECNSQGPAGTVQRSCSCDDKNLLGFRWEYRHFWMCAILWAAVCDWFSDTVRFDNSVRTICNVCKYEMPFHITCMFLVMCK